MSLAGSARRHAPRLSVLLGPAVLLGAALLGGGWHASAGAQPSAVLELTAAEMQRLGVEWGRPGRLDEQVVLSAPAVAVVPPSQETVVSAPVGGLVTRLLVAEGSEVDAGDPLIELRSLDLLAAQREYVDAVSASKLADSQLERDRMLYEEGIIARRRADEAQAQALAARVRAEQARQHLRIVGADDAELERLASTGRIAADLTLRAPGPGVVVARHGAVGEQVEALEPLVRLADLRQMWLEVRVPQERADAVEIGMRLAVTLRADAGSAGGGETTTGDVLGGEIFHVGRTVDPATQTVLVRAAVDNAALRLRAEQVLPARVLAAAQGEGPGSFAVPMAAVARFDGNAFVFAQMPTGVELVPVTVVGEEGALAHVASDSLGGDDTVAVRGVSALKALLTADEE
ncbi:MAG: efflux RND transporter periplasmic adaptor subunit [Gammaproteobacteria bacterium]|nr:efflux RND transporter periplasmic adaptor subunit [Gammaproteobacteria bacterium]